MATLGTDTHHRGCVALPPSAAAARCRCGKHRMRDTALLRNSARSIAKQRALYCDGCVDAMALLELRCNRISFRLLRRLPPLLTLSERSRAMRPLLCRRPPLYTHSVSVSMGVTCGSKRQCILETGRDGQQQALCLPQPRFQRKSPRPSATQRCAPLCVDREGAGCWPRPSLHTARVRHRQGGRAGQGARRTGS